mmetsp:Transcript_3547/g.8579  ORF Transcript_3547/g.8579 Transcript_3547/m.8579 type:complete len:272 (+) Transcript_3547:815-1630(+)
MAQVALAFLRRPLLHQRRRRHLAARLRLHLAMLCRAGGVEAHALLQAPPRVMVERLERIERREERVRERRERAMLLPLAAEVRAHHAAHALDGGLRRPPLLAMEVDDSPRPHRCHAPPAVLLQEVAVAVVLHLLRVDEALLLLRQRVVVAVAARRRLRGELVHHQPRLRPRRHEERRARRRPRGGEAPLPLRLAREQRGRGAHALDRHGERLAAISAAEGERLAGVPQLVHQLEHEALRGEQLDRRVNRRGVGQRGGGRAARELGAALREG